MKQTMIKPVTIFGAQKDSSFVTFSWNYYDSIYDSFHAAHFIMSFDLMPYGIRKVLFAFGSKKKRDSALLQMVHDSFIDFDLVDYSQKSSRKLQDRVSIFFGEGVTNSGFSYDKWVELMNDEPGYNIEVHHDYFDSHVDLTQAVDSYLLKGAARPYHTYNWEGFDIELSEIEGEEVRAFSSPKVH